MTTTTTKKTYRDYLAVTKGAKEQKKGMCTYVHISSAKMRA